MNTGNIISSDSKWSGLKFQLAQELGDNMDIHFFRYDRNCKDYDSYRTNHQFFDGVGMFKTIQEQRSNEWDWPKLRIDKKPSSFFQIIKLVNYLRSSKLNKIEWKNRRELSGASHGIHFASFSKEETSALTSSSKQEGGNLSSSFIYALDLVTQSELLKEGSERKWIFPVNMRSTHTQLECYSNCSSSVIFNLVGKSSIPQVHRELVTPLKEGQFWGGWIYSRLVKFIGVGLTRRMIRKMTFIGTGVVSNMGDLGDFKDGGAWFAAPPASKLLPIAATFSISNKELSFSIRFHPSLELSIDTEKAFLLKLIKVWGKNLSIDLSCDHTGFHRPIVHTEGAKVVHEKVMNRKTNETL